MMSALLRCCILALLSFVAAFFGLERSYWHTVEPAEPYGLFDQVGRDGWIENGSTIRLPDLASRGNKLQLSFHNWRPPGIAPAELEIYLCEKKIDRFVVDKPLERLVHLTGTCNPRLVRFKVLNPFTPSASDKRELGAQLKSVTITSKLGFVLIAPTTILFVTFLIFLFSVVSTVGFQHLIPIRYGAYLIPLSAVLLSFFLLQSAFPYRVEKLFPLWVTLFTVSLGAATLRRWSRRAVDDLDSLSDKGYLTLLIGILVTLGGAAFRFYGLDYGLPHNYHPDEIAKVNAVMRMYDSGSLNPQYFLHPSLLLYSTYAMNLFFDYSGLGELLGAGDFRSSAFLAGRAVSALAGSLSVFFLFLIAKRIFDATAAIVATAFFACLPLHIDCSRYLKEDSLLVFLTLIAIWLLVVAVQDSKKRLLLAAGFFAGASASVKYSGLLTVGVIFCAPWLHSGSLKPTREYFFWTVLAGVVAPIGFLVFTPYAVLDYQTFLHDFNYERKHMSRGHVLPITAWSQYWMYHITRSILPGMTPLALFLSLFGIGATLFRKNWYGFFLLSLVCIYYLPAEYVKAKPAPQPERYILPCLPFLALFVGEAFQALKRYRISYTYPLILFALVFTGSRSYLLAREMIPDTRESMKIWIEENVPKGSKIYIDHRQYSPAISEEDYSITYAPRAQIHKELNMKVLKEQGQEYLLLSSLWYDRYFSQPRTDGRVQAIIRNVFETFPLVQEYHPQFGTYGFHNPTVRLFQVR